MTEAVLLEELAAAYDQNVQLSVAVGELALKAIKAKNVNWQRQLDLRQALIDVSCLGPKCLCWCPSDVVQHTKECSAAYRVLHGVDRP